MTPTRDNTAPPWLSPRRAWWAVLFFLRGDAFLHRPDPADLIDPVRGELALSDTPVRLLQGLAFALVYSISGLDPPLFLVRDQRPGLAYRQGMVTAPTDVWGGRVF